MSNPDYPHILGTLWNFSKFMESQGTKAIRNLALGNISVSRGVQTDRIINHGSWNYTHHPLILYITLSSWALNWRMWWFHTFLTAIIVNNLWNDDAEAEFEIHLILQLQITSLYLWHCAEEALKYRCFKRERCKRGNIRPNLMAKLFIELC